MLHLHRSERADALVGPLAELLAQPPEDPFAPDVVAVPTRGVERWLAQRLSHHLGAAPGEAGVCANVTFGSPARLVGEVLAASLGLDRDADPWRAEHLTWPLLEVLDEVAGEPWCAALGRHLGVGTDDEVRRGRRLVVARHLARLFASYAAQRPAMVRAWAAGRDDDGAGGAVPADLAWQPRLWRLLRERLGTPSPAERLGDALRLLTDRPESADLPARLSVFGPTRLPEDQLRVLHALGGHRDVHLWLPHPSPALWEKVAAAPAPASPRRHEQPTLAGHPLLASMARDATELQQRLAALGEAADVHHPAPEPPPTLLGALQRRLRADEPAGAPHVLAADDRSVEVHACFGPTRQIQVLREVLAGLFAEDPTLEPRDVIVMCPDVEAVAPLVAATFGLAAEGGEPGHAVHPGQTLRVRLADRSARQVNPLLGLLAALLDLADGRVTASEVLDLAATDPVRRKFRLDDDDLARVRDWSVQTGVHWGENLARRERFGLPALGQGTWDVALDRLLLGAAMAEEDYRYLGPALPLDDVDSTDIDLAGRVAELLDRLADVLATLDGAHPLGTWLDRLDRALTLLAEPAPGEDWQAVQARWVLGDVRAAAEGREDAELRLPDVRALLADRLQGRPTRAGFRTGALTICSLEPMRAVPHRVVCLLGLDDGAFPRGGGSDGDDVLLREPCLGERDRRSEDRQLFLDAVAAAGERLVLLYSGADERTGAARPPAVPVGELLDALDAAATAPDGRPVRERLLVRHPLQVVDERNYTPGALGRPGPFSFDATAHRAALAGRGPRSAGAPFLPAPLPPEPAPAVVDLDDLVAALEHPAKWFLRQRLQVALAGETADVEDRLPLDLDPLESWQVGDRLLTARLAGADPRQAVNAEWRRGEVPPKELGRAALVDIADRVAPIAEAARRLAGAEARAVDVRATLPSGAVLAGTVPGVRGDTVLRATYSRLAPKHRLRAWVQLLALTVSDPTRPWRAVTVGRAPGRRPGALVATLGAPDPARAGAWLDELLALRERARREPLPLPVSAACAYASSRAAHNTEAQALEEADRDWRGGFERTDEHHVLVWGEADLADLAGTPAPDEQAWWPEERTRLGVLARRVWDPLLAHEETEHP
ncbi:exodeoxyribonuclease V subunit gamma [Georgenia thermotolerans]|uniref:RecBCD enzyme subunit RecC n=1 Tax=Georgenia thermotolerans TaxID=527326 RepID=A0A7J5USZ4_9MICO|nr:exodeoxyribonuclease V subunit gamma [Georgenia thermotolerans]KAE8765304.1 exodeoxyribonuclease V subunit gamma [Georgenia thermotolerans]